MAGAYAAMHVAMPTSLLAVRVGSVRCFPLVVLMPLPPAVCHYDGVFLGGGGVARRVYNKSGVAYPMHGGLGAMPHRPPHSSHMYDAVQLTAAGFLYIYVVNARG